VSLSGLLYGGLFILVVFQLAFNYLFRIVQIVDKRKQKGERTDLRTNVPKSERSAEETAKVVGVGASKVKEARAVIDHAVRGSRIFQDDKSIDTHIQTYVYYFRWIKEK
jgi:hypothetical protein